MVDDHSRTYLYSSSNTVSVSSQEVTDEEGFPMITGNPTPPANDNIDPPKGNGISNCMADQQQRVLTLILV